MGDVRIDESVLATFSELQGRQDRRLAKSAATGAVDTAVNALRSGRREDVERVARPWDVEALMEASARLSVRDLDDVVMVGVHADADPMTLVARLGGDSHLVLRGVGEQETDAWRAVRVVEPGTPVQSVNPESSVRFPLPEGPFEELRWICLALEDISEALGDRIYTMPGRPMSDETEELGQGETRRVQRLSWHVGPHGFLEATTALHEIFDGATPTWTHLHGEVWGLAEDAACLLNATARANETSVVTLLLSAPRARLDAAIATLAAEAERDPRGPGARAL